MKVILRVRPLLARLEIRLSKDGHVPLGRSSLRRAAHLPSPKSPGGEGLATGLAPLVEAEPRAAPGRRGKTEPGQARSGPCDASLAHAGSPAEGQPQRGLVGTGRHLCGRPMLAGELLRALLIPKGVAERELLFCTPAGAHSGNRGRDFRCRGACELRLSINCSGDCECSATGWHPAHVCAPCKFLVGRPAHRTT